MDQRSEMVDPLRARLARLERRSRISQGLWAAALSVGIFSAAVGHQDPAPVSESGAPAPVRASAFELVDESGKVRGRLGFEEGEPALRLYDDAGHGRVRLFWTDEGGGLYLEDAEGETRLGAALFEHGGAGFAVHGRESKGAATLYWKDEGRLSFFDEEGRVTGRFPSAGR